MLVSTTRIFVLSPMLLSLFLAFLAARFVVKWVLCSWGAAKGSVLVFVLPKDLWPLIRADNKGCQMLWLWLGRTGCKFNLSISYSRRLGA